MEGLGKRSGFSYWRLPKCTLNINECREPTGYVCNVVASFGYQETKKGVGKSKLHHTSRFGAPGAYAPLSTSKFDDDPTERVHLRTTDLRLGLGETGVTGRRKVSWFERSCDPCAKGVIGSAPCSAMLCIIVGPLCRELGLSKRGSIGSTAGGVLIDSCLGIGPRDLLFFQVMLSLLGSILGEFVLLRPDTGRAVTVTCLESALFSNTASAMPGAPVLRVATLRALLQSRWAKVGLDSVVDDCISVFRVGRAGTAVLEQGCGAMYGLTM